MTSDGRPEPAAATLLVHLHVPKCAGAAVNLALDKVYRGRILGGPAREAIARLDTMTVAERDAAFHVVLGHHVWGIQDKFSRPFVCFSATRDPLARICSYFNYVHLRPDHPMHSHFRDRLPDLGNASDDDLRSHPFIGREWCDYFSYAYSGKAGLTADDFPALADIVRARMAAGTLVVGRLPRLVAFLTERGILEGPLPRHNVTDLSAAKGFRPATPETLSPKVRRTLLAWNALDTRLLALIDKVNALSGFDGGSRSNGIT